LVILDHQQKEFMDYRVDLELNKDMRSKKCDKYRDHYMAKLGSHKRPAVVRVQDLDQAQEIMSICRQNQWQVIVGIEPDKSEDISDVEKLLNPIKPTLIAHLKTNRNDPCTCGSGKKYKKCCLT